MYPGHAPLCAYGQADPRASLCVLQARAKLLMARQVQAEGRAVAERDEAEERAAAACERAAAVQLADAVAAVNMSRESIDALSTAIDDARAAGLDPAQLTEAQRAVAGAEQTRARAERGEACEFWFVRAAFLRDATDATLHTLPSFQALRQRHPEWLERRLVTVGEAARHALVGEVLVVSHHLERANGDDDLRAKAALGSAVRLALQRNERANLVWTSCLCLPQPEAGAQEAKEAEAEVYRLTRLNTSLLYLAASVVIVVDAARPSGFWSGCESWLSMQNTFPSGIGVGPAPIRAQRCRGVVRVLEPPREAVNARRLLTAGRLLASIEPSELLVNPDDGDGEAETLPMEAVGRMAQGASKPRVEMDEGLKGELMAKWHELSVDEACEKLRQLLGSQPVDGSEELGQIEMLRSLNSRVKAAHDELQAMIRAVAVQLADTVAAVNMSRESIDALSAAIDDARAAGVRSEEIGYAQASLEEALRRRGRAERGEACEFWLVRAAFLRDATDATLKTLPSFQALRQRHPEWLERRLVTVGEAARHALVGEVLVVSHRWASRDFPLSSAQLEALRAHLREHQTVRYVWLAWSCVPQGPPEALGRLGATAAGGKKGETRGGWLEQHRLTMGNLGLLQLSASALILLDPSSKHRLWLLYEAWLSMQTASPTGLRPASAGELRCRLLPAGFPLAESAAAFVTEWEAQWRERSLDDALEALRDDSVVSNAGPRGEEGEGGAPDKAQLLEGLARLNELLCSELNAASPSGRSPLRVQHGGLDPGLAALSQLLASPTYPAPTERRPTRLPAVLQPIGAPGDMKLLGADAARGPVPLSQLMGAMPGARKLAEHAERVERAKMSTAGSPPALPAKMSTVGSPPALPAKMSTAGSPPALPTIEENGACSQIDPTRDPNAE